MKGYMTGPRRAGLWRRAGVHMGKVLIQIADTEGALAWSGPPPAEPEAAVAEPPATEQPMPAPACEDADAKAVFTARRDRSYVITGGLGGFGLALAAWLAARGAGHLVLTSKRCARRRSAPAACRRGALPAAKRLQGPPPRKALHTGLG